MNSVQSHEFKDELNRENIFNAYLNYCECKYEKLSSLKLELMRADYDLNLNLVNFSTFERHYIKIQYGA